MRVIEGNPANILNRWPLLLDTDTIRSVGVAWIFKEGEKWRFRPRVTGEVSLFYNAQFFARLVWPAGLFLHVRLSSTHLVQLGAGWKLNGRFALLLRVQTDASAARGTSGPNYGQATGWDYGTH